MLKKKFQKRPKQRRYWEKHLFLSSQCYEERMKSLFVAQVVSATGTLCEVK
jgi:hypothetical protein